jgi:Fe-S oxidoreductase
MTYHLQRAVTAMKEQIDSPTASFFSSCVHCGMCAQACLFHTETGDPKYTPIHKLEPMKRVWKQEYTVWGRIQKWLHLSRPLSDEELEEWEPLVYDSCTLCGRCSLVCPVGNDITYMIRKMREAMVASGHAPKGLKGATHRALETGSPMGVTLKTLEAHIKHAEEQTGLKVPVDVEGADYMVVLSSAEVQEFNEIIPALTRIFHEAGVSWTFCSEAFEGTNSGVQIGSSDIAAELLMRIVNGAEKLKVKTVIGPECGHAYFTLRWEGPNLIGRPYPFKVIHILELLEQLHAEGRLQTSDKDATPKTFHDPCQLVRRGGVIETPRHLLGLVAENFVEMKDNRTMNWCCGGGGGVSANERADPVRGKAFLRKRKQLEEIGVKQIVTACANCRDMLEDGLMNNNMNDYEVVGLSDQIARYLKTKDSTTATGE